MHQICLQACSLPYLGTALARKPYESAVIFAVDSSDKRILLGFYEGC